MDEAIDVVSRLVRQHLADEGIGDLVDMVDLDLGYSPVIPHAGNTWPVHVQRTRGDNYVLVYDARQGIAELVDAGTLRIMRARFLAQRDLWYQRLRAKTVPHSMRESVVYWFFAGTDPLIADSVVEGILVRLKEHGWQATEQLGYLQLTPPTTTNASEVSKTSAYAGAADSGGEE